MMENFTILEDMNSINSLIKSDSSDEEEEVVIKEIEDTEKDMAAEINFQ